MMKRAGSLALVLAALAVAGCAKPRSAAQAPLTEHQRDSVLAKEPIPGATGVGRALQTSDDEARRAAEMNARVDSLPR
jgi:hypothetical protein